MGDGSLRVRILRSAPSHGPEVHIPSHNVNKLILIIYITLYDLPFRQIQSN